MGSGDLQVQCLGFRADSLGLRVIMLSCLGFRPQGLGLGVQGSSSKTISPKPWVLVRAGGPLRKACRGSGLCVFANVLPYFMEGDSRYPKLGRCKVFGTFDCVATRSRKER